MQVGVGTVEGDVDIVAANVESLVMQWLVDVADEVDEEFEGILDFGGCKRLLLDAPSLSSWI